MLIKHISLIFILLLTGCAGMRSKYDCPLKLGITCKSVGEVNTLVDQGALPKKDCPTGKCKNSKRLPQDLLTANLNGVYRTPEKIMTIWMAPFKEETGVQHSDSYMNVVVREAQWGESQ